MGHFSPSYGATPPAAAEYHHPAVVVGGGLVGLTLALDLAQRGVPVVLLDDDDTVSTGSRAICFAKRTLEVFARLGLGPRMKAKGITWNLGRVFAGEREVFSFDLLPETGHEYPAFVNLQQYYVEEWLVEACKAVGVELRWRHRVTALEPRADGVTVTVATDAGPYTLQAGWLLACDGARSFVRETMGLPFVGRVFRDRFLIADVRMQAAFPTERWFWFDPPFHPNQSALLHRQPDDIWRIDLQLGWDADPETERDPARVRARVQAMLGPDVPFKLEWVSIYTFRCRRLERFVHGRVVFVGDSAHQVSPFGARGGNGGVQDADNLAWKLAAVLGGAAPSLIGTYDDERIRAADENILHSTRATDFITPKTAAARAYRDAVLSLAATHPFARAMVNSGRLSRPCRLALGGDSDAWAGVRPGDPAVDCPVGDGWLLQRVGPSFTLLAFGFDTGAVPGVTVVTLPATGLAAQRYGAPPGGCVLLRPDQHVLATFTHHDTTRIQAAIAACMHAAPAPGRAAWERAA